MKSRWYFGWTAVAVVAASLGGCATRPSPATGGPVRSVPAARATPGHELSEAELEMRIDAHAHFAMGIVHDLNGEQDQALGEFLKAAHADLGNELLVSDVARRLLQNRQPQKAADLLARAVQRRGASGALDLLLGVAYGELGKSEQAIQANRVAMKKLPDSLAPCRNLLKLYLQQKKTREARALLSAAAKRRSLNPGFLVDLAELYATFSAQLGKDAARIKPRVIEALDRAAKLKPKDAGLRQKLADAYNVMGEFGKAKAIYTGLLQQSPQPPGLREKLTDLYIRSGDKKGAREQLEAILQDNPTNPQVYYYLGSLAADDKDYARAVESYEKTLLLSPEFERVYYDIAALKITLNKPTEALAILDKARARFKQGFLMEFYTALADSRLKQYAEALRHFTAAEVVASATNPKYLDSVFYFQMAAAYERNKEYAQAEKYFQKCLQLTPDNAEAMNYLGYMWTERGVNLDRAKALIEKAVKSEPDNAAFLDSLGWVLFKLNQPHEALAHLLRAVQHSQEPDAVLYDHLGDIYAGLRQYDQAREAWRKSLSLEPSTQVEQKLKASAGGGPAPR